MDPLKCNPPETNTLPSESKVAEWNPRPSKFEMTVVHVSGPRSKISAVALFSIPPTTITFPSFRRVAVCPQEAVFIALVDLQLLVVGS